MVRFKGTNVFLNTCIIKERTVELAQANVKRDELETERLKFNKERSIWRDFVEDTPEMLAKMLD